MLSDQKILLAGLNNDERRFIESVLIRSGFDIYHIQWHDALPEEEFACVIINLERDAYHSASALLKNPRFGQCGCIMLLNASDEHSRLIAMTLGTDDIVYKPVHLRELIAKVSILIDKYLDRRLGMSTCLEDDIDLLQRLQDHAARKFSGTICFSGNLHRVLFTFKQGALIGANSGKKAGLNAITAVWRTIPAQISIKIDELAECNIEPAFETSRAISHITDTIQTWQKMFVQPHTLQTVCSIDWRLYAQFEATLPRQVRRIIQLFDGIRTIDDIFDAVNLDDRLLVKILFKLAQDGILRIENGEQGEVPLDQWVNQNLRSGRQRVSVPPERSFEGMVAESAQSQAPDIELEVDEEEFDEIEPTPSVILYAKDLRQGTPAPSENELPALKSLNPEERLERNLIEMCRDGALAQLDLFEPDPVDPEELERHTAQMASVITAETRIRDDMVIGASSNEMARVEEKRVKSSVDTLKDEIFSSAAALNGHAAGSHEEDGYGEEDEFEDEYEEYEDDEYYDTRSVELNARGILEAFSRINPGSEDEQHEPVAVKRADQFEAKPDLGQGAVRREDGYEATGALEEDGAFEEESFSDDFVEAAEAELSIQETSSLKKFPTPDEWQRLKLERVKRISERRNRLIQMGLLLAIVIIVGMTLFALLSEKEVSPDEAPAVEDGGAGEKIDITNKNKI